MNEIYSIDMRQWLDAINKVNYTPNPWGDTKPEGLTSGEVIRQLDNVVFQKNPFLQRRAGYVPVVYGDPREYLKFDTSKLTELSGCSHEYKLYQGFTESYEYCTKCNEKRG